MKVYVVMANWCDNTWIDSIHDSEAKAKAAVLIVPLVNKNNPKTTDAWVEVWDVQ